MGSIKEIITSVINEVKEKTIWEDPQSVGVAPVKCVLHPSRDSDMVFIYCGWGDITGDEFVFTPPGLVTKGQVVEVIIQEKRQLRKPFDFPDCRVAIRPFGSQTYGTITPDDEELLNSMLQDGDCSNNKKNAFYSRAFYRKFFPGAGDDLIPFPDIDY